MFSEVKVQKILLFFLMVNSVFYFGGKFGSYHLKRKKLEKRLRLAELDKDSLLVRKLLSLFK